MSELILNRSRIVAITGKLVSRTMSQHVCMSLKRQSRLLTRTASRWSLRGVHGVASAEAAVKVTIRIEPKDFGARVIRQGRDGEGHHGLLPAKSQRRSPAAARARRSGAICVAELKPTGRSPSLGNQAITRPMMREYGLRSPGLRFRARFAPEETVGHQDANPAPSAQG